MIQWGKITDAAVLGSAAASVALGDTLYFWGQWAVVILGILWYLRQFYISFKKDK